MGNRVKGRTKKKSIKAAIHSGSSTHQKLSRMGKVRKRHHAGLDATFIGRAKVLKKLQISLRDFRRLCILKGIYPRQPKKAPRNKKGQVFYHIKDVKALSHEPLLDKFREFRSFMKKVRRSANRNEKDEARRKEPLAPKYTLHHLVRERYPRFADALGDLDDALCLIHLFACLPSEGKIKSGITRKAQQLAASWGAYCSVTGSVTKSFISVKGVYLEADIMVSKCFVILFDDIDSEVGSVLSNILFGFICVDWMLHHFVLNFCSPLAFSCTLPIYLMVYAQTSGQAVPVRWVTPHNFTQHIPDGVDFRVMLTFFEFYETLLGFVLYKLYGDLGVRYPLPTVASSSGGTGSETTNVSSATLHPTLGGKATSVLAANLSALQMALNEAAKGNSAADAVKDAMQTNNDDENDGGGNEEDDKVDKKTARAQKRKQRELMQSIDEALKGVEDGDDNEDDEEEDDEDDFVDEDGDDSVPIAAPLREALEAIDDSATTGNENENIVITNPEAQKRHQLFHNMTFFLSREVPRGYLELIILSYGGKVGWEGQDSPFHIDDTSITHHVIDRPKLLPSYSSLPKSREFIQPQWILDSANFNFILPIQKYGVGHELPPHLSPWVDDNEEGYVPKYKEEIEKIRNGEILDENEGDNVDSGAVTATPRKINNDSASEQEDTESNEDESEEEVESEEEEEDHDDEEAERKANKKKQTEVRIITLFLKWTHLCLPFHVIF